MATLDPVLQRWLRSLGDDPAATVPDPALWKKFLTRVNGHLAHLQEDRDLLTRSLELSTTEMNELHGRLKSQRDALEKVVGAAADAMGVFRDVSVAGADGSVDEIAEAMADARQKFTVRLTDAVQESDIQGFGTSSGSIRGLQTSFMVLADQLTELVSNTSEAASLRKQLEVAGAVQKMLMPERNELVFQSAELAAWFQPAASCGGDWWTANALDDGRLLVVIGDVTGHGVSSAIITGIAKGSCDLARIAGGRNLRAASLIRMMNSVIFESARRSYMMTSIAMVLDPKTRELTFCNAGHPSAWLLRRGRIHALRGHRDPPLGATPNHRYNESNTTLEAGDRIVAFTDGVTEYENPKGDQFTEKRLRRVCERLANESSAVLRDGILDALEEFGQGTDQEDDVTFLVFEIR